MEKSEKKAKNFDISQLVDQAKENSKLWFKPPVAYEEEPEVIDEFPEIKIIHDSSEEESDEEVNTNESSQIKEDKITSIPYSQFINLDHGDKTVSALSIDHSGSRVVSGGVDFTLKLWDFGGMDNTFQSFRNIEPCGNNQITATEFNSNGEMILVTSGSAQPKVLNRDGMEIVECIKGDQYIVDVTNTKGHIAFVNEGCWNPRVKDEFLTCSNDGSLRIWNVETADKKHANLIKIKAKNGAKTIPTGCSYDRHGQIMAVLCQDGSLQVWDKRKKLVNAIAVVRDAHTVGSEGTLAFSYDNNCIATRGTDDCLKLWDLRTLTTRPGQVPQKQWVDLSNRYPMTNCVFSPNDRIICAPTSCDARHGIQGKLVFLDRSGADLAPLEQVDLSLPAPNSVKEPSVPAYEPSYVGGVRVVWHARLNQIATSCTDGNVKIFYDNNLSHGGAMLCARVHRKRSKGVYKKDTPYVITPYALPLFKDNVPRNAYQAELRDRQDPIKSYRPELPVNGPGAGGRIASTGGTLHSFVVKSLAMQKPVNDDQDPRQALIKYAAEAAEDPYWTKAYKKTQPHPVFQDTPEDGEDAIEKAFDEKQTKKMKFS